MDELAQGIAVRPEGLGPVHLHENAIYPSQPFGDGLRGRGRVRRGGHLRFELRQSDLHFGQLVLEIGEPVALFLYDFGRSFRYE